MLSRCSISRACLFWVMHQKQNALPTETADNISDPIIYSVEDLNIPCGVVFLWVFFNPFSPGYSREGLALLWSSRQTSKTLT